MAANTEFNRPDEKPAPAYFTQHQTGTDAPGVVVIQEWWRINDQIERVANQLAEAGDPGAIDVPLQGHFAKRDQMFPSGAVAAFDSKLKQAGVDYEFHYYDADHAFGNEDGDNYDPEADKLAWQYSLDFFDKPLGG